MVLSSMDDGDIFEQLRHAIAFPMGYSQFKQTKRHERDPFSTVRVLIRTQSNALNHPRG